MSRLTQSKAMLIGAALASLGGCATSVADSPPAVTPPAWFDAAAAEGAAAGFPSLDDVPAAPRVATASDPAWEALQTELTAERATLQGNERATPAPADADAEAEAFRDGAVRAIEDTRRRY